MALEYPQLKPEPGNLVYPVLFNITAASEPEPAGGTSRVNIFNVSHATSHLIWVVESGLALPGQIGIATTYAGQVALYKTSFESFRRRSQITSGC